MENNNASFYYLIVIFCTMLNIKKVNDDVVGKGPQFVKYQHNLWVAMSIEQLQAAVDNFRFVAKAFKEDNGSITLSIPDFDIVASGET